MKRRIYRYVISFFIVREWIECGEFESVDRIIIIGSKIYAVITNYLLRNKKIDCNYCDLERFIKIYKLRKKTKWIIFDENLLDEVEIMEQLSNREDVIISPLVYEGK